MTHKVAIRETVVFGGLALLLVAGAAFALSNASAGDSGEPVQPTAEATPADEERREETPTPRVVTEEEALAQDAASYAEDTGIDQEEAERRMNLQSEMGELGAELRALAPSKYAASWIQRSPEFKLMFAYTDDDIPGLETVLGETTVPVDVRFDYEHSVEDLRAVLDDVHERLPHGVDRAGMGIDLREGRVKVELLPTSSWSGREDELEDEFGVPFTIVPVEGTNQNSVGLAETPDNGD